MGIAYNAKMPTSGLVLALDCANPKSYSPNVFGYALDIYSWVNAATGYNCALSRDTTTSTPLGGIPIKMVPSGLDPAMSTYNSSTWNLSTAASGQTWTASVWVKSDIATNVQIFTMEANNIGAYLTSSNVITAISAGVWTRISCTRTFSDATTAYVQIRLDGPDSGFGTDGVTRPNIWFDGLQVERTASATPFNPRQNVNSATILDMSGSGNHGTLVNAPIFSAAKKGIITTNGTSSCIRVTSLNLTSSNYTVIGAARYLTTGGRMICGYANNWLMSHWNGTVSNYYAEGWVSNANQETGDTVWRINAATGDIAGDYYQLYKNGSVMALPYPTGGSQGPNGFSIGATGWNTEFCNGEFSFLYAYNRVLSPYEITQCYEALRGRFDI